MDLGGVNLNDITTSAYSARLDPDRFVSIGINDVMVGQKIFGSVRLADVLPALMKLKIKATSYHRKSVPAVRPDGKPSDRISMQALYPRYASFLRAGDTLVLETGSSTLGMTPMTLPDGVRVEFQVLWGSIGWATAAALGIALADPSRRVVLITGEGSHQLTANEIGSMGRFGAKVTIFVLNNDGYMVEALEENPDWSSNDLAQWKYADLPRALGCADWFTAHVETLGEIDAAMQKARSSTSGALSRL